MSNQRGQVVSTSKEPSSIRTRLFTWPGIATSQTGKANSAASRVEEQRGAHAVETAVIQRLPQIGAGQVIAALQETPVQESQNRLGPLPRRAMHRSADA